MVRLRSLAVPMFVLGLASGLVYAMLQIHDLAFEVQELRSRLSRTEAPAPRFETSTTVVNLPASTYAEQDDLSDDVARLQAELAALREALGIVPPEAVADGVSFPDVQQFVASSGSPGSANGQPIGAAVSLEKMTPEQQDAFKKAVLKVVADKSAEDAQRQRARLTNKVLDELAKSLGLAGPQLDRAKQILADGMAKVNELRRQTSGQTAKQTQKEIQGVWKSMDQNMRALLTVEQVTQYDTWRTSKTARNYFGPPASQQKPAPRPARPGKTKKG